MGLMAILSLSAAAKGIDEEAARMKAEAFMKRQLGMAQEVKMRRVKAAASLSAGALFGAGEGGEQPLYIFNREGGGYVIVSGDDRTFDILGYGYKGEVDIDRMPANMRSWLEAYAEAIASFDEHEDAIVAEGASRAKRVIEPRMKTQWDQGDPYNLTVPYFRYLGRTQSGGMGWVEEPCVTGCAATAAAQVMYYHRYPDAVLIDLEGYKNDNSFMVQVGNSVTNATVNNTEPVAAGSPIDWDNMLLTYENGGYTQEQALAVAHLMQYLGTAFKMQYGLSSGAYGSNVLSGVEKAFGYSDAYVVFKDETDTYEEWIDCVYNEVEKAEVVVLAGQSNEGGHMFVLDGYEGEDFFHVNWGWGGYLDGYFRLLTMDPGIHQGTGGTTSGYEDDQYILAGLGKGGKGATTREKAFLCRGLTAGELGQTYMVTGDSYMFPDFELSFYNANFSELKAYAGLGVYDANGNLVYEATMGSSILSVPLGSGYRFSNTYLTIPASVLKNGVYSLLPLSSTSTSNPKTWRTMHHGEQMGIDITVANGRATLSKHTPTAIYAPQVVQPEADSDDTWRTLDGRILNGKPATPGVYLHGSRKVLVSK